METSGTGLGDGWLERHRDAIHTVAQAGWARTVVKHVSQVPAAAAAVDLDARYSEHRIGALADCVVERLPEAGPAGAAVELGLRGKELKRAAGAAERARPMLIVERARERAFGAFTPQHGELRRCQQLLPFLVGVRDLERGTGGRQRRRAATAEQRCAEESESRSRTGQQQMPSCQFHRSALASGAGGPAVPARRPRGAVGTGATQMTGLAAWMLQRGEPIPAAESRRDRV